VNEYDRHKPAKAGHATSRSLSMNRLIAFAVSFALVGVSLVFAQEYPAHPQGQPHDRSSHPTVDPQQHALMHGQLVGAWTGTLTSTDGVATKFELVAASDSHGALTLRVTTDNLKQAKDVSFASGMLRWTQAVSGASCKAAGTLSHKAGDAADTLKGTMACKNGEMTFALQKATK